METSKYTCQLCASAAAVPLVGSLVFRAMLKNAHVCVRYISVNIQYPGTQHRWPVVLDLALV